MLRSRRDCLALCFYLCGEFEPVWHFVLNSACYPVAKWTRYGLCILGLCTARAKSTRVAPTGGKYFAYESKQYFAEERTVWLCVPGNVAGFCCNSHAGELLHDFANADYVLTGTRDKSFGTSSVFSSAPLLEGPKITRLP